MKIAFQRRNNAFIKDARLSWTVRTAAVRHLYGAIASSLRRTYDSFTAYLSRLYAVKKVPLRRKGGERTIPVNSYSGFQRLIVLLTY